MSPRPRTITNQHIAQVASELLIEQGPAAVTFAEVSQRCGLAPPTLVQRFGGRSGLLDVAAQPLAERVRAAFARSAPTNSPLAALLDSLETLAPTQAAAAFLSAEVDLSSYSLELRKQISFALANAVDMGELPRCDVAELARTLQITFAGAVTTASLERRDAAFEIAEAVGGQLAVYV